MDVKLILAVFMTCVVTSYASDEHVLLKLMLKKYHDQRYELARPVLNSSETLNVKIGLQLINVDMDEDRAVLTVYGWIKMSWSDNFLTWDPDRYNGVKSVSISPTEIWLPDMKMYKSLDMDVENTLTVVSNEGSVLWIPPVIMKLPCTKTAGGLFSSTKYSCPLVFGSWVHNGFQLDPNFYGDPQIDMSDYAASNVWKVGDHAGEKRVTYYPCCAEPYPSIRYNLTLTK